MEYFFFKQTFIGLFGAYDDDNDDKDDDDDDEY
jgi:hypothetical protein